MAGLRIPIIATVIGEGGSGGALAIAIGDITLMLQYATYSVISPEGCASILWKSADNAAEAAENAGHHVHAAEAAGPHRQGRHRTLGRCPSRPRGDDDPLKKALTDALRQLQEQPIDTILEAREDKILAYGKFKEISAG
jgi:acetyl-CoA carboxylase carboxyl transferase subunit alpha